MNYIKMSPLTGMVGYGGGGTGLTFNSSAAGAGWLGDRGLWMGGYVSGVGSSATCQYVAITTAGNASTFGNLTTDNC